MQLFRLDDVLIANKENDNRYPVAYIGKNISINQNDLSITLRKECGDNILLFGQNDNEQVTRSTMNIFLSLLFNAKNHNLNFDFKVINFLNSDDSPNLELLFTLESMGYCKILNGKNARGQFLKQLAEDIINETAQKTILFVLGQERFRELKFDMEFDNIPQQNDKVFGFSGMKFSSTSVNKIASFRQALEIILDKGPEQGVHAIMQLDKPSNYLFKDYVAPKDVYQKFKHLIMLKSEESAGTQLRINDNIRLQILSKDLDRLRAYYYSEESDSYTLFTPYRMLQEDELLNLLKLI